MSQVAVYVDGFNLYHAINDLQQPFLKWLNLQALAKSYLSAADNLVAVVYFTAMLTWDPGKYWRHMAYIDALEATGVEVIRSKFLNDTKYCRAYDRYCKFRDEKQTDVAFAIRILSDIQRGLIERAILLTGDSDQIPLVEFLTANFPAVSVEIAAPPRRLKYARELASKATSFSEISEGRLRSCLLPRNVEDGRGRTVAVCPASYVPL